MLPLILLLGYVPLIIRMVEYDPGLSKVPWGYEGNELDFFLTWKMRAMLAISVIMLCMLIYKAIREKANVRHVPRELWLLLPYSFLVLMSGTMSPWRYYAFYGSFEMFRTVPLVLSYILMCIYGYFMVRTPDHLLFVAKGASFGVFIMGLIGALQTIGINVLNTDFVKLIMLPAERRDYASEMTVEGGVYATLFNPDYLAVYIGLILPVTIVFVIIAHDLKWKIFSAVIAALLLISLVGTGTASEFIAIFCTVFIGALIVLSRNSKHLKIFLICAGAAVLIAIFSVSLIPAVHEKIDTAFFGTEVYRMSMNDPVIETLDDGIHFTYPDGQKIILTYDTDKADYEDVHITVTDEQGDVINLVPYDAGDDEFMLSTYDTEKCLMLDDEDLELTILTPVPDIKSGHFIRLSMMGKNFDFTRADDGSYYYITPGTHEAVKTTPPDKVSLFPDAFMSGRGWIWNYSLSMLKNSMVLGTGSNTFIFEFPHNYAHYADDAEFDVKPHSMYLQQWIENGLPALILLTTFVIIWFAGSINIIKAGDLRSVTCMIIFGLLLGIISFIVSGLVNDAMMFISPFFWILTGMGIRLYHI